MCVWKSHDQCIMGCISYSYPLPLCFTTPPSSPFTLAPPLTVENILTAVQGVVAWKKLGKRLIYHVSPLRIYPKLDEIERQHQSDDSRLHAVIECWLQGGKVGGEPSWRRIIWALDDTNETKAADSIRHFAEPLPGKSCDSITFLYSV